MGSSIRFREVDAAGNVREGLVCCLESERRLAANRDANARLIAAAPELLEELKSVVHAFDVGDQLRGTDVSRIKRAIAKATEQA